MKIISSEKVANQAIQKKKKKTGDKIVGN